MIFILDCIFLSKCQYYLCKANNKRLTDSSTFLTSIWFFTHVTVFCCSYRDPLWKWREFYVVIGGNVQNMCSKWNCQHPHQDWECVYIMAKMCLWDSLTCCNTRVIYILLSAKHLILYCQPFEILIDTLHWQEDQIHCKTLIAEFYILKLAWYKNKHPVSLLHLM